MSHAPTVTRRTAEIAALLTIRADELLEHRYGAEPPRDPGSGQVYLRDLLVAHAVVVAGTERLSMVELAGEVDFAASEFEELVDMVIAHAEENLPVDVVVPAERVIPVRRVGVRAPSAAERFMEEMQAVRSPATARSATP